MFHALHPTPSAEVFLELTQLSEYIQLRSFIITSSITFTQITQNPLNFLLPSYLDGSKASCFFPHQVDTSLFKNVNQCHSLSKKPPGTFHLIQSNSQSPKNGPSNSTAHAYHPQHTHLSDGISHIFLHLFLKEEHTPTLPLKSAAVLLKLQRLLRAHMAAPSLSNIIFLWSFHHSYLKETILTSCKCPSTSSLLYSRCLAHHVCF